MAKGKGNGKTSYKPNSRPNSNKDREWDNINKPQGRGVEGNTHSEYSDDTRRNTRGAAKGKGTNHIEWYVPDQNMLASVANIPFGYRTGDEMLYQPGALLNQDNYGYRLPGIVRVNYEPGIGVSDAPNSQVNVASTAVYSYVRHANSGSRNYDHSDLMIYMLALDSIYSGIAWLSRARGLAQTYNRMNRYIPSKLLLSMGINPSELIKNLTSYTDQINTLILKATTLAVPSTFPLFVRHAYMNTNVYTDLANDRAQMYYFSPVHLHKFMLDDEGRGKLSAVDFATPDRPSQNFQSYIDIVQGLVDAIYGDEDAGIMSGDIIKAYGGNIIKLATLANDYSITPIYDEEMLEQIHNATVIGGSHIPGSLDIEQDTVESETGLAPIICYRPQFIVDQANVNVVGGDRLFDLHCEPTAESVMRSSRLCATAYTNQAFSPEEASYTIKVTSCGSEIIRSVTIFTNPDGDGSVSYDGGVLVDSASTTNLMDMISLITAAQEISYFPMIYAWLPESSYSAARVYPIANTDKVTVMTNQNIRQLNNVALLGLFNVPRLSIS